MKILLINKFHYLKGGSETYYFGLQELLKAHGHQVINFAMKDDKNLDSDYFEYFVENTDFNKIKGIKNKVSKISQMLYSKDSLRKIKSLIEKERPDIIHIGLIHKQITYSILDAIKEYNIPIVQSVHDLIFICPNYKMLSKNKTCEKCVEHSVFNCIKNKCVNDSLLKSMIAVLEYKYIAHKKFYNQIDMFITESNFYYQLLSKAGFQTEKLLNIPNFLPSNLKIEFNINQGNYFLFFGRFSEEKGLFTLLKAYKKLNTTTKLIVVGGGPLENEAQEYIKENNLNHCIDLAGYVYGNKMEELIRNSKAVIVPSEWYENCPYSVIESMAKSRPIIASDIGGLPELIKDRENGLLFEPTNIHSLIEKIDYIDNMSQADYKQYCINTFYLANELFNVDNYYNKIIDLYTDLINKKRMSLD